jgi:hypothetical protein
LTLAIQEQIHNYFDTATGTSAQIDIFGFSWYATIALRNKISNGLSYNA